MGEKNQKMVIFLNIPAFRGFLQSSPYHMNEAYTLQFTSSHHFLICSICWKNWLFLNFWHNLLSKLAHCKYLHLQYISTTTLEMHATSASGVQLQDVVSYLSCTSISHSADLLQFKYILSVVAANCEKYFTVWRKHVYIGKVHLFSLGINVWIFQLLLSSCSRDVFEPDHIS